MLPAAINRKASTREINVTADYSVNRLTDNGATFTNTGASGAVTVTLPTATIDQAYKFRTTAAQAIKIDCQSTDDIQNVATAQNADGQYTSLTANNCFVEIMCRVAGHWIVTQLFGTLTDE